MNETTLSQSDFFTLRAGLASIPTGSNHAPDQAVHPDDVFYPTGHRAALDPDRPLVVGNRGMGKSFWSHVLAVPETRKAAATRFKELEHVEVYLGFNASERSHPIAPTPNAIKDALKRGVSPDSIWRTVLLRVALETGVMIPPTAAGTGFSEFALWVEEHVDQVDQALTNLDEYAFREKKKLLVVFDALDRLSDDWHQVQSLASSLIKRSLATQSYRSLRLKLFMRRDQFDNPLLFQFPDASKVKNSYVRLSWTTDELYELLFHRLASNEISASAFKKINPSAGVEASSSQASTHKAVIDLIAGEFMGADKSRGRVYTWVPLHLADSRDETSPRTFLTAWSEAARHAPAPADKVVDHFGLLEGVRRASSARLSELREDYPWIQLTLDPLQGQMVPMDFENLKASWRQSNTETEIKTLYNKETLEFWNTSTEFERALLNVLTSIGIMEKRTNGKINIPDIFRVEAGIKRKGGVKPPKKSIKM